MTVRGRLKPSLARLFDGAGINSALLALQERVLGPYIRAVNYHGVPVVQADRFEAQLRFYREHYEPVCLDDLLALQAGRWRKRRPGILLSFDDGVRSHADVVAPLLERHGFIGWFMVPVGFVDTPPLEQRDFARLNHIGDEPWPDGRIAMTWDDVRRLDERHVIGCHTIRHRRLGTSVSETEMREEIVGAKRRLEGQLGHPVLVFAWVGGEEWSYSVRAARIVREAGFTLSFMTNNAVIRPGSNPLQLQRTNVEARDSRSLVRFSLSGALDLAYAPKRRRVNRLTA